MKAKISNIEVTGTPAEIAELMKIVDSYKTEAEKANSTRTVPYTPLVGDGIALGDVNNKGMINAYPRKDIRDV
jgi:hypothetical protein